MHCNDCNKELKGGFGVGSKPYTEHRCADCVIKMFDHNLVVRTINEIQELAKHQRTIKPKNRRYKEAFLASQQLYDFIIHKTDWALQHIKYIED